MFIKSRMFWKKEFLNLNKYELLMNVYLIIGYVFRISWKNNFCFSPNNLCNCEK